MPRSFRLVPFRAAIAVLLSIGLPSLATAAPHLVRTLPNKMALVVRENRTRPLVTIQAWIKSGARDESKTDRGAAWVVPRLLLQATQKHAPGEIERDLSIHGATYGSEVGYGYSMIQITLPARYFTTGVDLLAEILTQPRLGAQDLEQAIGGARNESRALLATAERAAITPAREALHGSSPMAWPFAVPELELAELTMPLVRRFYQTHYVAENAMVVVVGDVEPEEASRRVEAAFQGMPRGKVPSRPKGASKPLSSTRILQANNSPDTQGAAMTIAFRAPAWNTADALALDVLMALLVDSPTSRARKRLDEGGASFDLAAAQRSFDGDGGTIALSVKAEPAKLADAESAILTIIQQARSSPVSQEELDAAVENVLARELYPQSELRGIGRATALAVLQGRPGADEVLPERLRAVRAEDLSAVASQYLNLRQAAIVEMLPRAAADSLNLREGYEKRIREKVAITEAAYGKGPPVTQSKESERRARIDGPLGRIPSAPRDAGRARVERTTLAGGLRLLTSEDRSISLVTVGVYLNGGVRYENDRNNGVTTLLRETLLSTSDPRANGAAYRTSLPDLGRFQPYLDRDMWGVSLSVPADSWREAVSRLGAMFAHPELDTVTVDATRIFVLSALDRWLDDESAQRGRLIFPTKYQVSGYRLPSLGTRRNLVAMPLDEVERWYRTFIVRGNLVVAVFGDVRAADVATAVDGAFREVSSKPFQPGTVAKEGEFGDFRERWELGGGPDATVTLAFGGPPATSPDVPAMYVVNSVLSGPRGWFAQYLDTHPTVRSSTSTVAHALDEVPILASVTVQAPIQEEIPVRLLFRQFKKIAYLPLTGEYADTLHFAKTHAAATYLSVLNSNTGRAFQWSRGELFGLGVDYPLTLPAKIDAVTAADLTRIGLKYFQRDEFNRRPYAIAETRPGGW